MNPLRTIAAVALLLGSAPTWCAPLTADAAKQFARLALDCVHREYPNKVAHVMRSDDDARPPRVLTPAFYGCYDWHSSVHGHWLLARAARRFADAEFAARARSALDRSLTEANIAAEVAYLRGEGRASFERPYGLAWLLQLTNELRTWSEADARRWATTLAPLEREAAARLKSWLPNLRYAIREGEHDQTAFAFGLIWDWAQTAGDAQMLDLLRSKAEQFYRRDKACALHYEPSGQDFLSPCLAEADFMRRTLAPDEFARWLGAFLPVIPSKASSRWLEPAVVTDRSDPKLAHLDGLNLSRAWMLEGIARGLPPNDPRVAVLRKSAEDHRSVSLPAVTSEHYVGSHWLGTFALYGATQ